MKKLLSLTVLGAFSLFFQPAYAGHDFMAEMRKFMALTKKESCSNGETMIEHRLGEMRGEKFSLVLVIFPDAASKKSQFFNEENKGFYSMIFYKMYDVKDEIRAEYLFKDVESGNLEKLDASQWFRMLRRADPNAAKSLMQQPGSDCITTYQALTK